MCYSHGKKKKGREITETKRKERNLQVNAKSGGILGLRPVLQEERPQLSQHPILS
jgi:hypothetical protein